jgi:hypothetical protein
LAIFVLIVYVISVTLLQYFQFENLKTVETDNSKIYVYEFMYILSF